MKPVRIQLSRKKGWRMPPNTVKADRSTKWGNHWVAWKDTDGQWYATRNACEHHPCASKQAAIRMSVEKHAAEWRARVLTYGGATELLPMCGKNIACWCALDAPCHVDIYLELSNQLVPN